MEAIPSDTTFEEYWRRKTAFATTSKTLAERPGAEDRRLPPRPRRTGAVATAGHLLDVEIGTLPRGREKPTGRRICSSLPQDVALDPVCVLDTLPAPEWIDRSR